MSLFPVHRRGEVTRQDFARDPFDFMTDFFRNPPAMRSIFPLIDVHEQKDKYILKADLPGVDADKINIDISGEQITISGNFENEKSEKDNEGNLIYHERSKRSFERSFSLPGISEDKVDAQYKDGVLTISLPKTEEKKRRIAVKTL